MSRTSPPLRPSSPQPAAPGPRPRLSQSMSQDPVAGSRSQAPVSRPSVQPPAPARWRNVGGAVVRARLIDLPGSQTAAWLGSAFVATSTSGSYPGKWERFAAYCRHGGSTHCPPRQPLSAHTFGSVYDGAKIAGPSLQQYVAPIRLRHDLAGVHPNPAADPLVAAVLDGLACTDCTRVGKAPKRYLPLPAVFAGGAIRRCLSRMHGPGWALFCGDAQVVTSFLLMARPSCICALRCCHIHIHLTAESFVYKGDEEGPGPTRIVSIPVFGPTRSRLYVLSVVL